MLKTQYPIRLSLATNTGGYPSFLSWMVIDIFCHHCLTSARGGGLSAVSPDSSAFPRLDGLRSHSLCLVLLLFPSLLR